MLNAAHTRSTDNLNLSPVPIPNTTHSLSQVGLKHQTEADKAAAARAKKDVRACVRGDAAVGFVQFL